MRRLWVISAVLIIELSLTACGSRTELNDLGITIATGIDGHKGDWTVTYQVILPSAMSSSLGGSAGGGSSQAAVHTFSTQGKTIREAIDISNLENPRKLYFAHNNVIIIGKQAAEEGIEEVIDNYFRNPDARETVKVLVADRKAREILIQLLPPEKLPGQALSKILQKDDQTGSFYPSISIYELALKISSDSGSSGVPEVSIAGSDDATLESADISKKTSSKANLRLTGLSIFDRARKVGTLNQAESLGISWLTNHMKSSTLSFEDENAKSAEKALSSFRIIKAKVKVTPVKGPLHFSLDVKVKVAGELVISNSEEDPAKTESIKKMQHQVEKVIELQIKEGWKTVQKLHIDLVGIADKIHRKYPRYWKETKKNWPEELSRMDINIDVQASIKRPGLFQKSFSNLLKSNTDQ
ncbi:Ger(x)C family spore germination protein [Paenibacillus sp. 19GGS1-52]|uniref:Ger(x)C family spore germination protein n=1 Tax=Paenibacillus sp. 19GGS1-52 TaxID=2758563 RepID=UPI001EFC06A6|nr:Ger(x)C family spore germination protein [Paenibacillus sp. 19GGS1-52]ULO09934.1 Ger(x)C family spore germination protein [Paenibacillus sp. 19GGS1-52]